MSDNEDCVLEAAWQRCEAALPKGWCWMGVVRRLDVWQASIWHIDHWPIAGTGETPIKALTALAETLETRNAQ